METGRTFNRRAGQQARAPKIRLSCDSCQASKIRCGQERPACRRCVKYNIDCVYSPSRRAGRPRPRKTTTPAEQPAQPQPSTAALPTPNTASPPRDDHDTIVVAAAAPSAFAADSSSDPPGPCGRSTPSIASAAAATSGPSPTSGPSRTCGPSPTSGPSAGTSTSPQPSTVSISDFLDKAQQSGCWEEQQQQQQQQQEPPPPPPPSTGHQHYDDPEPQQQRHDVDPFSSMVNLHFGAADAFSAMSFPDFAGACQLDDSALPFDFMLSPMQDCGNPGAAKTPPVDSGSSSSPSATSSASTENSSFDHAMHDVSDVGGGEECLCAATLLQHLAESPPPPSSSSRCYANSADGEAFLATAVQKSKVLLDHCFRVLCCAQCGPRLSSALMLCQAMDEISVALGMGTLWADGGDGLSLGGGSGNLARDEVPLRCGTYSVRGADRRVVLRALIMRRLAKMQSAMGKLQQVVALPSGAAADSACQSTCAGMVLELRGKVTSRIDLYKVLL